MKIIKGKIAEDFSRDLFWTRIRFISDDSSKKTLLFTCASQEYLDDLFELSGGQRLESKHFEEWITIVEEKWTKLGEDLFNQDLHYDVYANTQEGEANGIDFLLKLAK